MGNRARAIIWAAFAVAATARADKDLAYRFVPGNEYRATCKFERTTRRSVKEKRVASTQTATVGTLTEIKSVDAKGLATVEVRIVKVEFADSFPQRKYVSDDPRRQDRADGWELYKDARLLAEIDAKGKVASIKPDADTAAYWADQPREFRDMLQGDGLARFLPFALPLPEKPVATNVGWRHPRTVDEGRPFGKREMFLLYSYAGNRKEAGHAFDEIAVRGEVKPPEASAKYDLLLSAVAGRADFETAKGELWSYRVVEDYLYNPKGAKLPKHVELTGGAGKGGDGDAAMAGEGEPGMKAGKGEAKMGKKKGDGKMMGKGEPKSGKGKMKGKEGEHHEPKEDDDADKSIELQLVRTMKLSYHGKPLKEAE